MTAAQACCKLGFDLLDKDGNPVPFGAEGLRVLAKIKNKNALPALKNCVIRAACDVTNPLCGENGCSAVFGPQKGATLEMIREMDGYMRNYAALTKELYPESNLDTPGAARRAASASHSACSCIQSSCPALRSSWRKRA